MLKLGKKESAGQDLVTVQSGCSCYCGPTDLWEGDIMAEDIH